MKLWIDNFQQAPEGYSACKTIEEAKNFIQHSNIFCYWDEINIDLIDIYIGFTSEDEYYRFVNWLNKNNWNIPIIVHM